MKHKLNQHTRLTLLASVVALTILATTSCSNHDIPMNAIYFWRSELKLTPEEQDLLRDQQVTTVFLHVFDVIYKEKKRNPEIINRISFTDKIPKEIKVVPVVFIDNGVFLSEINTEQLADIIFDNVTKMMKEHGYSAPSELQIDCDWDSKSESQYFRMLKEIQSKLEGESPKLSNTIRFHHLTMNTPPTDYVALMLYDTKVYHTSDTLKTILNYNTVHNYLQPLMAYKLPLATVLPTYGWDIIYSNGKYRCVGRGLELKDTTQYEQRGPDIYRSKAYKSVPIAAYMGMGGRIYPGDEIMHISPSEAMLDSVASLISRIRPGNKGNVIMYRLEGSELNKYTKQQLKALFEGGSMADQEVNQFDN